MATRRPDLEAMPYKDPGYISMQLFPPQSYAVKAGTYYYQNVTADADPQTDRTLATAPSSTTISSSSSTWSMGERITRRTMDNSEILQLGGIEAAQAKAARIGKRAVMGRIEALAIAATFGAESSFNRRDILGAFLENLQVAVETVRDYADGPIALIGAAKVIDRIKRYDSVVERMQFTGVLPSGIRDVRGVSNNQLAAACGVDVVLGGPSTPWLGTASVYDGWLGVCVLPDAGVDADEEIQLGRTFVMPVPESADVGNIFTVETFQSDNLRSEVVDVSAWTSLELMNPECFYILTGCDEENANTTTTTTA